jgi:hypothetical protein
MGKVSQRSVILGIYRSLIVKYHKLGKDATRLMDRLRDLTMNKMV